MKNGALTVGRAHASAAMRIDHAQVDGRRIRFGVRPGDPSRLPLLLLNGLGANIELMQPFVDALPTCTIVMFDVPGVGGSPTPSSPYRVGSVARLAERLLDQLGIGNADVLGVSWGGVIAQEFALRNPVRCRRLVLAATATGALMVPGHPAVLVKMITPRRYLDREHSRRVAGEIYGGDFRRDDKLHEHTMRHIRFESKGGYYMQLAAAFGWTSVPWLWMLRQPTLIMAGEDDPIVPPVNAQIMAWLIPDSRVEMLDCGHLFLITRPDASGRHVDDFLREPRARERVQHRPRRPPARTKP